MAENTERLSLESLREDYRLAQLDETDCHPDPLMQFEAWLKQAISAQLREPNAMDLATVNAEGRPSARIVLLKEVNRDGFVFYTNYGSQKGREIAANPHVALTFYWAELERQVRVEGQAERVSRPVSEAYFRQRPRGSQLGAWVSHQSEVIQNRAFLESKLHDLEARFAGQAELPPPDYWGGYCVRPEKLEFWQGRTSRLHDRIEYRLRDGAWLRARLSP